MLFLQWLGYGALKMKLNFIQPPSVEQFKQRLTSGGSVHELNNCTFLYSPQCGGSRVLTANDLINFETSYANPLFMNNISYKGRPQL